MKAHVVTLAAVIVAAGAAYAADETITMNAIDANGVGKEIGTLRLSDTNAGLEITPALADLPPGNHGFHVHVNPNCGPGNGPNGQPAAVWRRVTITTRPTPANTSDRTGRATRATWQC
jgi:Cu-Zn family superoxide dismutase